MIYQNVHYVKFAVRKPHFTDALNAEKLCVMIAFVVIPERALSFKQSLAKGQNSKNLKQLSVEYCFKKTVN